MRSVIRWLLLQFNFNHRRRQLDVSVLWPICKEIAHDLDHARTAFALHAFKDPAWRALGEEEIARRVDALS